MVTAPLLSKPLRLEACEIQQRNLPRPDGQAMCVLDPKIINVVGTGQCHALWLKMPKGTVAAAADSQSFGTQP